MKIFYTVFIVLIFSGVAALAQSKKLSVEEEAAYTKTINERAGKIVDTLGITNEKKATKVKNIVAKQYRSLNNLHSFRDAQIADIKAKGGEKELLAGQIKTHEDIAQSAISKLHTNYLNDLSALLTPQQVEQVKDGMTYGVVPITYKGYVEMIPSLKEEEKEQILAWLIEAREQAMDAETSDKKHWWFGKYKGKINNYLSARGYDITKEREEWNKRIAAKKNGGSE